MTSRFGTKLTASSSKRDRCIGDEPAVGSGRVFCSHTGASLRLKPQPFRSRGWWPNRRSARLALTLNAGPVLVTAEAVLIGHASAWRALALTGAALSLVFFLIFFQPLILSGS